MSKHQITKSFWADPETRQARMRLEMPFSLVATQPNEKKPVNVLRQWWDEGRAQQSGAADSISALPVSEILPKPEDLVYFTFRAISQRLVECYSVDYSRPGVLEASVPMLVNQRVCKDHENRKAEDAVGKIVESFWDAQGKDTEGLPGINIRFFVDAKIEPRLVRLLSYGGVHSGSVTVAFEWEPSHPDLLEQKKFWWLLGETVDGETVRMIVTKILYYDEFSAVYEGADSAAKRVPDTEDEGDGGNDNGQATAEQSQPQGATNRTEGETTVKLNAKQKEILGLAHTAEDVPETDVIAALDRFVVSQADTQTKLAAADAIIKAERAEVLRLATLAEAGADGALNPALAGIIEQAAASQLPDLKKLYEQKAAAKYGNGRSSTESSPTTGESSKAVAAGDVNYL